jgi:hypothetical protein
LTRVTATQKSRYLLPSGTPVFYILRKVNVYGYFLKVPESVPHTFSTHVFAGLCGAVGPALTWQVMRQTIRQPFKGVGDRMKETKFVNSCALAALVCLLLAPVPAIAENPDHYESNAEVYTERGEIIGCGLSFVIVWTQDKTHLVGASGSENFFFAANKKNVYSMFKVGGMYDMARQPVSYAWVETSVYGKTTSFSVAPVPGEVAGTFVAVKYSDGKTAMIPGLMSAAGFNLGVTFGSQPLDNVVELPPSDQATIQKVQNCMQKLSDHMTSVMGQ